MMPISPHTSGTVENKSPLTQTKTEKCRNYFQLAFPAVVAFVFVIAFICFGVIFIEISKLNSALNKMSGSQQAQEISPRLEEQLSMQYSRFMKEVEKVTTEWEDRINRVNTSIEYIKEELSIAAMHFMEIFLLTPPLY